MKSLSHFAVTQPLHTVGGQDWANPVDHLLALFPYDVAAVRNRAFLFVSAGVA